MPDTEQDLYGLGLNDYAAEAANTGVRKTMLPSFNVTIKMDPLRSSEIFWKTGTRLHY